MKKAVVFLADGLEEIEGLTVVDLLRRAGIEVTTVSIKEKDRTVTGSHGIIIQADSCFETEDFSDKDLLVLPGGMPGTTNLGNHAGVVNQVMDFYRSGRMVAAICAAPTVFGQMGILKGRTAVCYPGLEGELTGATVGAHEVEVSDNVTTSRGMGTAIPFALSLVAQLSGQEASDQLAKSIVYSGTRG